MESKANDPRQVEVERLQQAIALAETLEDKYLISIVTRFQPGDIVRLLGSETNQQMVVYSCEFTGLTKHGGVSKTMCHWHDSYGCPKSQEYHSAMLELVTE